MRRFLIVCTALCCLIPGYSLAQKKIKLAQVSVWSKEPSSFLGIKIGEPIADTVRYCPEYESIKATASICLKATSLSTYFKVENLPSLGFWYDVALKLEDGKPLWFSITSLRTDFKQLEAAFFDRYGEPTNRSIGTVQTVGGAEFNSRNYSWIGKVVQIDMSERGGTIDESSVTVSDRNLTLEKIQKRKEASKQGASNF